jgi:hypothetical protein
MHIMESDTTAEWQKLWGNWMLRGLDDDDELVGCVKDVKDVEKRIRHRLLPRNAWRLVPFFEVFMSAPRMNYTNDV